MSILNDDKYGIFYALIHDWILSRPTQHVLDTFGLKHARLCKMAHPITKGFLTMFYALTLVNDFTILHNIQAARTSIRIDQLYAGMRVFEEDLNQCDERTDSILYYDELSEHSTCHGLYEVEAILEDSLICSYPKAWIGHVYKSLWPFLSVGGEIPPGIHTWKHGKRTVFMAERIPLLSRPLVEDDLYS
jgi:hypothetical protein